MIFYFKNVLKKKKFKHCSSNLNEVQYVQKYVSILTSVPCLKPLQTLNSSPPPPLPQTPTPSTPPLARSPTPRHPTAYIQHHNPNLSSLSSHNSSLITHHSTLITHHIALVTHHSTTITHPS